MSFSIKQTGLEQIISNLNTLKQNVSTGLGSALSAAGQAGEDNARSTVPVDTGHLQSTIYSRVSTTSIELGADADYAVFVEFGTRKMGAQPYLRPSAEIMMKTLTQEIQKLLKL